MYSSSSNDKFKASSAFERKPRPPITTFHDWRKVPTGRMIYTEVVSGLGLNDPDKLLVHDLQQGHVHFVSPSHAFCPPPRAFCPLSSDPELPFVPCDSPFVPPIIKDTISKPDGIRNGEVPLPIASSSWSKNLPDGRVEPPSAGSQRFTYHPPSVPVSPAGFRERFLGFGLAAAVGGSELLDSGHLAITLAAIAVVCGFRPQPSFPPRPCFHCKPSPGGCPTRAMVTRKTGGSL